MDPLKELKFLMYYGDTGNKSLPSQLDWKNNDYWMGLALVQQKR